MFSTLANHFTYYPVSTPPGLHNPNARIHDPSPQLRGRTPQTRKSACNQQIFIVYVYVSCICIDCSPVLHRFCQRIKIFLVCLFSNFNHKLVNCSSQSAVYLFWYVSCQSFVYFKIPAQSKIRFNSESLIFQRFCNFFVVFSTWYWLLERLTKTEERIQNREENKLHWFAFVTNHTVLTSDRENFSETKLFCYNY